MPPNAEMLSGGVLRMNSLTGMESGNYRCKAENAAGVVEKMATLRILEEPRIRIQPEGSITLVEGSPLSIKCTATGDPVPVITWKKMGNEYTEMPSRSPTLQIERVSKADEGVYSCVATNEAGSAEERVQVLIEENQRKIQEYPVRFDERRQHYDQRPAISDTRYPVNIQSSGLVIPVQTVEHEITTSVGMNVDLTCLNVGSIPPNSRVVWTKPGGAPISSSQQTGKGVLHIRKARLSDQGVYRCELVEDNGTVLFQLFANLAVLGHIMMSQTAFMP